MKRFILCFTTFILLVITFFAMKMFVERLRMPFNSEGNYFDPISEVVYHQQSVISYGIISFLFALVSFFMIFRIVSLFRRSHVVSTTKTP